MSDVAVTWAKAQDCPDRNAKQVLVHLASYADAEGEAWAMVPVLALEMQVSDRTIQRGLRALAAAGLIRDSGRTHRHRGRVVPIWSLQLDVGPANTRRRMAAAAAAAKSTGDACVTPSGGDGVTQASPQDGADVTPWGDTGVTQIGKGISQGLKPSARACATAIRIWASKAPERVAPVRVAAAWGAAVDRTPGLTPDGLLRAVQAAVRADPDFGRGKAMNLDRWLDEGRFAGWLGDAGEPGSSPGVVGWSGPDEVRAAVVRCMGEAAAVSYVDSSAWDAADRRVKTRTRWARDRLRAEAGRALKALGVTVEQGAAHGA